MSAFKAGHDNILGLTMSGQINWIQAAEILGISSRQMRRWKKRYELYGYDGLYDRRRKMPSPRRISLETATKILTLYREKYFDFNMSHFYDKLKKYHNIRKPLIDMMLHMDGSPHDWFKNGVEYDIVTICIPSEEYGQPWIGPISYYRDVNDTKSFSLSDYILEIYLEARKSVRQRELYFSLKEKVRLRNG